MSDYSRSREVGRSIAAARQAADLTQRELAERMGWPRFSLISLELGRRGTTVEKLDAVAAALVVSAAVFLIDDPALAAVVTRLAREPEAVADRVCQVVCVSGAITCCSIVFSSRRVRNGARLANDSSAA